MSKKLLLADDSITIQKVIQITFAHEDYELTVTDNGDSALAKALEIKPDLVMADIYMPGKNGYELTSAIKQNPALQRVPVLLLAGSFEPFDEDKARSCKADAWIEKPFESQTLIDKVAELLSAAREVPETPEVVVSPATPAPVVEAPAVVEKPSPAIFTEPQAGFLEPQETVLESQDIFTEEAQDALPEATSAEPDMAAAPEDPFGDISFEEENPSVEAEPVAVADDWSDFIIEPPVAESTVEDTFDTEDTFTFVESPAMESAEPAAADFATIEDAPVAETDFDVFEMGDDEIMSLGDDDILGEEDLEPIMPEQTLAAWSRDETNDEDIFAEPIKETPAFAEKPPAFTAVDPVAEETPVFAEPESAEEPPAVIEELEPAAVAAAMVNVEVEAGVDVEAMASSLSEEDVEKIIEKVVTKVVEKFAESILERVAWEVVPDLAEKLIREEIRKIKDAAA